MSIKPVTIRIVVAFLLLAAVFAAPGWSATSEFRILVNRDLNLNSGCDLTPTPPGPPGPPATRGLEQILTATVTTGPGTATVTSITNRLCTNSASDIFGPAAPIAGATGGVGQNNGVDGFDVVEICVPYATISAGPPPQARIGLISSNLSGSEDQVFTPDGNGNQPILLGLQFTPPIPTLSEWGLILMALLLAAAAAVRLRKRPRVAGGLMLLVVLGTAGMAWAVVTDGLVNDWQAGDRLATDPIGDALLGADVRALFGKVENNQLCFRIDASLDIPPPNGAPDVQPATFSVPENSANGTVVGTVVATDPQVPATQTLTYSITGGNTGGAFAINPTTGEITVATSTALNFETTPTFSLTVTATDNGTPSASGSDTITINLTDVNDAPVANDQTFGVAEASANGTVVGTVVATDEEVPATQALTYVITGGDPGGVFTINAATGQITVANGAALDNETMATFSLTVTVTDNGTPNLSDTAVVTINVTDANDPPVANDATFSLDENSANGTAVGTVTGTDPDVPAQTLTWSITGGNTGSAFAINATTGEITVATVSAVNFETTPTFTLTVTLTDNGTPNLSDTATVTINLNNVNDAPVANDATFNVAESSASGTVVGTVTATDEDVPAQTLTYAITAGNTGGAFTINAATGEIAVANSAAVDSETTPTFTLTVTVTDNGTPNQSDTATVTVNVTDQNDPPVSNDATFSIPENSANSTAVGTVTATDPEVPATQTLAYSITGGNTGGAFAINATTGAITVATSSALDFETTPTFTLTVTVTDNGTPAQSDTATITINLTDVNESPVAPDQAFSVDENSANGTVVGTVTAIDPEVPATQTLTFAITAGNAAGVFAINTSTGAITVANGALLNAETTPSFTLTVTVTDNGTPNLSDTATVTLTVNNVNEPPVANDATFSVAENSASGTNVGTVTATDQDLPAQTLTYAITGGNAAGGFSINSATGQITVANSAVLNFETAPSFTLTVTVTDNGTPNLSDTATITINLTDVNEAPTANDASFSVDENSANGTAVGTVTATDPEGQTLTFAITGGNTGGAFAINATTGAITVANGAAINFETAPSFTLTVTVTDSGTPNLSDTATVTITINNLNEPPVANDASFSVDENSANGTAVGTVVATDPEVPATQTLTYSITGGNTGGAFAINAATGAITVANGAAVDFETTPSFTLTVTVTDNGTPNLSDTATVTVTVNNLNEAPTANDAAFSVAENSANGTAVGTVTAIDPDLPPQTLTFSITGGTGVGVFAIDGNTGAITVANSAALNFETATSFTLTVTVTDSGTPALSDTATVTITVLDVNEPPVANDASFMVNENSPNATVVGTVPATDPDTVQTLTYAITSGNTGGAFAINPATGVITVANSAAVNFEVTPTFTLTVTVTDNGTPNLSDTATITIGVVDLNEAPTAVTDDYSGIGNTQLRVAGATAPAVAFTTDPDSTLINDTDPDTNPAFRNLAITPATGATTKGGSFTITNTGAFHYTPPAGFESANASDFDTFQYTLSDGSNTVLGTVRILLSELVWYVKNDTPTAGNSGHSVDPFNTLAEAEVASTPNDYIYVFRGNGTTSGHTTGIKLKNGQRLLGEGVDLVVSATTLVDVDEDPLDRPVITDTVESAVEVLANTANGPRTGIEIRGLNITSTAANAVNATSADAAALGVVISQNTISGSAATFNGIDINAGSTSTTTVAVHDNDLLAASATALDITRTAGTLTITRFDDNIVNGNVLGSGIVVSGPVTFDGVPGGGIDPVSGGVTVIGAPGNGVGGSGLVISGMTGTLAFTDLDIFADAGAGLRVGGTGVATTNLSVGAGVATVQATGGPAVDLSSLTTDLQLTSLTSLNSASTGVSLATVNGTFSAGSGSAITNATGTDFAISGGTANVTYGGTITDDVGQLVSISGATAGTKSFTGAITDGNDGDGSGISLTGNTGATISFSGGVTLSTSANPAFAATGGGTLRVTGTTNTITTTTGTALNVANTTIHADDLTFRSVSSNGAASGIILNNTGALGGLTVSGTGAAGSGGTIQNTTSHAISLVNARDVVLNSMNILDPADSGVFGDELTNFTINNSLINGAGDTTVGDEAGLQFEELLGNSAITNTTVSNSFEDNIRMLPSNGVLTNLAITGSTIGPNPVGTGANGLTIVGDGTANVTLTVTATTFTGNQATGFLTTFTDTARHDITITNSTFTGNNIGIQLSNSLSSDMDFDVSNNTFLNHANHAILIVPGSTATNDADVLGTIANNIIGNGTVDSGSRDGHGIRLDMRGDVDATVAVTGNTIRNTDVEGIFVESRLDDDADAEVGHLDLTLRNNNAGRPDDNSAFPFGAVYGTRVEARNSTVLCLDIAANDAENVGVFEDIRLRQRDTSTFRLERFVGNGAVETDVEAFVTGQNPLIDNADATRVTSFTGVANGFCENP